MMANDLLNRYGIKLPHEIGKPLYIQEIDVKKDFWSMLAASSIDLIFSLLGAALSIGILYWTFAKDHPEGIIAAIVLSSSWYFVFYSLRNFMVFPLIVVGDKGIIRYFINHKGKVRRNEILLFSHTQICELYEGLSDPHSPVNKGQHIIKATWKEGNKVLFMLSYLRNDLKNKQVIEAAIKAFETYRITRNQS
ncbi:MAG: hypothetical protein PHQ22_09050 [Sulfuricurvum sp.]|nr:hypothetical protein [Sulfuricurvum sp.]